MDTLINPSTGTGPRASMQSRRSSHFRRSEQVDIRNSTHFPSHPSSLFVAGKQPRDGRGHPLKSGETAPQEINEKATDSDAGHKKLEAGDMTHSDSGWSDGFTDEERARLDKRVLRKTDLAMLPLMGIIVMLQYLDKAILSYAALLGLQQDLGLGTTQYNWASSIYYFGLLAGLILWTVVLQKVTTDLVIGAAVTIWGIVCMCHAATHNYSQILAVRFFLGFFESAITPAFILIVGQFYTERETVSRTAIWYSFNGVALILGGGMSYGLLLHPPASNLAIWRELYLILGGMTIFFGLWTIFLMPSSPAKTRLFTEDERKVALTRVTSRPGQSARSFFDRKVWTQSFEAIRDPRLYIIFLGLTLGSIPNGGVTAYSVQLLAGFGYPLQRTLLLTLAPGGAQIVSVLLFILASYLARSRALGGFLLLTIAIAGSAVMFVSNVSPGAHVVGYTLLNMGSPAVVTLYSFNSAAVGGHGKRVVFAICSQAAYGAGNIIGPLTFLAEEVPIYRTAKIIIIASLTGAAISLALIFAIHFFWNKKRDAAGFPTRQELEDQGQYLDEEAENETDFNDTSYRYVL
ncbi:unnamed protein product [Sympodiomycopsis kandeliae]